MWRVDVVEALERFFGESVVGEFERMCLLWREVVVGKFERISPGPDM